LSSLKKKEKREKIQADDPRAPRKRPGGKNKKKKRGPNFFPSGSRGEYKGGKRMQGEPELSRSHGGEKKKGGKNTAYRR